MQTQVYERIPQVPLKLFEGSLILRLLCQFLVLYDGCGDGGECKDSMVEHCEDSVIDFDGDCDIQSSFSLFFFFLW